MKLMLHYQTLRNCSALLVAVLVVSCSHGPDTHNVLTPQEKSEGWQLLFDGKSLKGWHVYNKGNDASAWLVDDDALYCDPGSKIQGDLVSDSSFENFELRYEWRIQKAGNSGVTINVQEAEAYATPQETGPEFQLLDNENVPSHAGDPKRVAGSMYGVVPLKGESKPKPHGEWNEARIVQQAGHIVFYLNGIVTCDVTVNSDEWKALMLQSKLHQYPDYAKKASGRIALQNYHHEVWFRALRIRRL